MLNELKKALDAHMQQINAEWDEIVTMQCALHTYENLDPESNVVMKCVLTGGALTLPMDYVYDLVVRQRNKAIVKFIDTYLYFQSVCLSVKSEVPTEHTVATLEEAIARELGISHAAIAQVKNHDK